MRTDNKLSTNCIQVEKVINWFFSLISQHKFHCLQEIIISNIWTHPALLRDGTVPRPPQVLIAWSPQSSHCETRNVCSTLYMAFGPFLVTSNRKCLCIFLSFFLTHRGEERQSVCVFFFFFYDPLVFYLGILFDMWVQMILPVIFFLFNDL